MTAMLASVMSQDEALLALDWGADIIDFKNPREGALGALPIKVIDTARETIEGRVQTSATIGDAPMVPVELARRVELVAATGVDFVKIGLFGGEQQLACIRQLAEFGRYTRLVGVLFADASPELDLLTPLSEAGFAGVMIDTKGKSGGGLRHHLGETTLRDFVETAHGRGLFAGLAGSLRVGDIAPLLTLQPDYLGFRGALCVGGARVERLDEVQFQRVRQAIPALQRKTNLPYSPVSARPSKGYV